MFATEQREVLFTKRRSLETTHGIIGFRTGTPKLKNRKGFTWAAVLELVKTFLPKYIRLTEEITRDKMLADRDEEGMAEPVHQVRRLCRSGRGVLCRTQKGEGGLGRMEKTREYRRTTVELCRNCGGRGYVAEEYVFGHEDGSSPKAGRSTVPVRSRRPGPRLEGKRGHGEDRAFRRTDGIKKTRRRKNQLTSRKVEVLTKIAIFSENGQKGWKKEYQHVATHQAGL